MISLETTPDAYLVRIPREEMSPDEVAEMIEWIRVESVARANEVTEAEADALAEEMKADWWAKNEHRFIPSEVRNNA